MSSIICDKPNLHLPAGITNVHGSAGLRLIGYFESFDPPIYHTGVTVLISHYTNEGFAVGADSLRKDARGKDVTKKAKKIHETKHQDFVGVYGFAGEVALEFSDRPMLNILEQAEEAASSLIPLRFENGQRYVASFCDRLVEQVGTVCQGIYLPDDFLWRSMFVGYFKKQPLCAEIKFSTSNGRMASPEILELSDNPIDRLFILSGSQIVLDEMGQKVIPPATLAESVALVRDYVTRCINNDSDPHCSGMGGQPLIATVTEAEVRLTAPFLEN